MDRATPVESTAESFATTRWSLVLEAGASDSHEGGAALNHLCQAYWYPLYSYVRRRGHPPADAADLTQEFFRHFLEKGYFGRADPARGRFRTFLLTSLNNFLIGEHVRSTALKRGGAKAIACLDENQAEEWYQSEWSDAAPSRHAAPDRAFDRNWALMVMRCAMDQLQGECARADKASLFARLQPFLARECGPGEYGRVGQELGLSAPSLAVAVHRLRQRYRDLVRQQVAETVSQPAEVDEELRHLLVILAEQL